MTPDPSNAIDPQRLPDDWLDTGDEDDEEVQIEEYDLSSVPNDFNVLTTFNFIESGAVRIPGFQRNYVWDLPRASKLIESLILGLPVPQVFLYESGRNDFLVIDGQQRLLTIYFFMQQRFPRPKKRGELRAILAGEGLIPDNILHDDAYFSNFRLRLPDIAEGKKNKFSGLSYATLGEYKTQFELRTIRNIIVKQIRPSDDDSSIYEMFHRLNSGGVNLRSQEIRSSLYYSPFFEMLSDVNGRTEWRSLVAMPTLDMHLRDTEILLRALAMFCQGDNYSDSMARFLNRFSKQAKSFGDEEIAAHRQLLIWFIDTVSSIQGDRSVFLGKNGRFSVTMFESAFYATGKLHQSNDSYLPSIERLSALRDDEEFLTFSRVASSHKQNVAGRLRRALELLGE
jgi:hypothetical protein